MQASGPDYFVKTGKHTQCFLQIEPYLKLIIFILSPTIPGTARHGKSIPSKHKYVNK